MGKSHLILLLHLLYVQVYAISDATTLYCTCVETLLWENVGIGIILRETNFQKSYLHIYLQLLIHVPGILECVEMVPVAFRVPD